MSSSEPAAKLASAPDARRADRTRRRAVPRRSRPGARVDRAPPRRADRDRRRRPHRAAGGRARPARGRARPRQDAAGEDAGRRARPDLLARAVHARPDAVRHRRHQHDRRVGRRAALRVPAGADLRQPRAGRRDQPRHAQDPVGPAGGDAGAGGHRRQDDLSAVAAVLRARHPEPDRDGGHLPAARGAARPLLLQAARRVPGARRAARDPRPHHRRRRGLGAGGARPRPHPRDARAGAPGAGGAADPGLRRAPDRGDPPGALAAAPRSSGWCATAARRAARRR